MRSSHRQGARATSTASLAAFQASAPSRPVLPYACRSFICSWFKSSTSHKLPLRDEHVSDHTYHPRSRRSLSLSLSLTRKAR